MGRIGQRGAPGSARPDTRNTGPESGSVQIPKLTLRWESALPMQEAELKVHDAGSVILDEDHYFLAVFGIPRGDVTDDSKRTAEVLKKQASLKPEGKRDLKPSSVEIFLREDGPVVVYLFPKSDELTWRDHRIEFTAQVSQLKFAQSFSADDMFFHGKLEL